MKKGQTATEYLIILAVVIIIALIVVGVMGGIPGMGGGAKSKTSMAYWSTAEVAISSATISSTQSSLTVRNPGSEAITVHSIILNELNLTITPYTILPGSTYTFTSAVVQCTTGSYSYPVMFYYTKGGSEYTFNGGGQTLDGSCAQ